MLNDVVGPARQLQHSGGLDALRGKGGYLGMFCTCLCISLRVTKIMLFNPFAPGDFAEKCVLKLVEWFSGHCRALKS